MLHISDSFPSQWVVVLEGVLVALGLLLGATSFPPLAAAGRAAGRALVRMGRRPVLSIGAIALTSALLLGIQTSLVGAPQPRVVDEWCYLLAADTFAHNRMTNPPHPMAAHFDGDLVLQSPTYASRQPPAHSLVLAIGQVALGHPARGLWLEAALLVLAVGWMLLGWVPRRWAIFGAVLVALRLGAGSYWNESYWGGSVAAIGGALLIGATRRLWRRVRARDAALLAIGLALLVNSRPYAGLLAHGVEPVFVWQPHRLAVTLYFFLGLPGVLAVLTTPAAIRDRWSRFATVAFLSVAIGQFFIDPWWVHYSAPALGALVVVGVQGHRLLYTARCRGLRAFGPALFATACVAQIAVFLFQIPSQRADATDPSRQRGRIAWEFEHRPGKHLLLVTYPPGRSGEWTFNRADVDAATVVWATDLGAGRNDDLLRYYSDRTVWTIDARFDATDPVPRLLRPARGE